MVAGKSEQRQSRAHYDGWDLTGKCAVVTGGGVGIGRAVAESLAHAGAEVAYTYLTHGPSAPARESAAEVGRPRAWRLDATDGPQVDQVLRDIATSFSGDIDILVNNAGGLVGRVALQDMDDAYVRRVVDLNLTSALYCSRAALRHMNRGWGRIVNISSVAGESGGGRGGVGYAAAKAGLFGLTRALAKEVGPRGITVNAIAPGLIVETPFHETFSTEAMVASSVAATPVGSAGYPRDVAQSVLYLACEAGRFVTGAVIDVNGGVYFS